MGYRFFTISNTPTKALVDLLKDNIIGTPGLSMLYQHLQVQEKVDKISDPFYVSLVKGDNILGTCCFCSRDTWNATKTMGSFYLRYFTFKAMYRSSHKTQVHKENPDSKLRSEIKELLSGNGLGQRAEEPFFHYAYVDPKNSRSLALCNEFGFEPVRKFSTVIFNRINPKKSATVEKISPSQVPEIREKLISFYKNYTMFSFENLFNRGSYYVVRDQENNIVAGVQANPDRWKVLELPGLSGKIILNLFSSLPYLNRLIKKEYEFITLEGLFVIPGNGKYLEVLFESILAQYDKNSAMLWVDRESSLYTTLRSIDLGILDKINHEVTANVICKFVNVAEGEQKLFKSHPAYISGTDLT